MSFLKRLFGKSQPGGKAVDAGETEHYEGYELIPSPHAEGNMFRLQGIVAKGSGDDRKEHLLIRADMFPNAKDAGDAFQRKARILIDQMGDKLFD